MEDTRRQREVLRSIESEFRRYRHLGASAIGQLHDAQLTRVGAWTFLSIPPVGTSAYNANPTLEKPPQSSGH